MPSAQTNTLKKILKAEHRLLRVCLLVTLNEENSRREKRVPAAGASNGGGRPMRQPTLMTGSKRPFGSLQDRLILGVCLMIDINSRLPHNAREFNGP